eukprot:s4998_g6.t1
MAWASAKLSKFDLPFLDAAAFQFLSAGELNSQNLAGMAWAFSTLERFREPLAAFIPQTAAGTLREAQCQEIANLAWASSNLHIWSGPLMLSTCWECRSRAPQLLPQELSNLAWSSGKLFAQDQLLSQTASEACLQNAGQFGPQNLSNAAWRFATSAVLDRPLMQMTSDQGINISGQLDAQDVSNLGRASSTLDSSEAALVIYLPEACSWEALFKGAAQACVSRIQSFDGQHLANTAWGLAHLHAMDTTLLAATCQRLGSLVDDADLTSQSCADLHWALGILQADDRLLHSLRNHAGDVGDTADALARYQRMAFDHQEMPRATQAFGLRAKRALEMRYGVLQPWRVFAYLEYAAAPEGSTDPEDRVVPNLNFRRFGSRSVAG